MKRRSLVSVFLSSALLVGLALSSWPAAADDDDGADHKRSQATASFGRGLNTAQPGNSVNHAVLPKQIKIKAGGVVDFAVAGFHDIIIFKPGFTLADLAHAGGGEFPSTPPIFVIPADPAARHLLPCRQHLLPWHQSGGRAAGHGGRRQPGQRLQPHRAGGVP